MSNGRLVERRKVLAEQLGKELERLAMIREIGKNNESLIAFFKEKESILRAQIAALNARDPAFMFSYIGLQAKIEFVSAIQSELLASDKVANDLRKQVDDIDNELSLPSTTPKY